MAVPGATVTDFSAPLSATLSGELTHGVLTGAVRSSVVSWRTKPAESIGQERRKNPLVTPMLRRGAPRECKTTPSQGLLGGANVPPRGAASVVGWLVKFCRK